MENLTHLRRLSECMSNVCPPISRYLEFKALPDETVRSKEVNQTKSSSKLPSTCAACGSHFNSTNHHVRLKARQPMTKKLQNLLQKYNKNPSSLSNYHKNYINRYLHSRNYIVITCHVCSKTTKVQCQSRPERSEQIKQQQELAPVELDTPKSRQDKRKEKKKIRKKQKRDQSRGLDVVIKDDDSFTSPEPTKMKLSGSGETTPASIHVLSLPHHQAREDITTTPYNKRKPSSNKSTPVSAILNSKVTSAEQQNDIRPGKRKRSKDRHQLLNKMLAQEKKKNSSQHSLSAFLSSV